jgi:molybdopterin-containing oxidoreductase family iron-sulfur binding subunit
MEKTLNPDVSPRMRGVVEKCNFCHGRQHEAETRAALEGKREVADHLPACAEACPSQAITFGNVIDKQSNLYKLAHGIRAFRLLYRLGTEPKVFYLSSEKWVRDLGEKMPALSGKGGERG